jgi:hypothetical protein
MFETLFANPAALTLGGAMISSPILIHLINRMRFKRLRWAAMEFLLKSQKRNRRRLIIEQMLLLLLRCLLIALAGLLLARFIGFTFGNTYEQKANLHIVILDDSLSMKDRDKDKDDAFTAAKKAAKKIGEQLAQSTTNDGQVNFLLSQCVLRGDQYLPKEYRRLNDASVREAMDRELAEMQCTSLSLPLAAALKRAKEIADTSTDRVTVHILTDFRKIDWGGPEAKEVHKLMSALGKNENVKMVYLIDCSAPTREPGQGGAPQASANLGIVEVRPNTRVASTTSTIVCTVTVANYSAVDQEVKVVPFNDVTGEEISEKDYETPMPMRVPAGKTAQAVFSFPIRVEPKEGEQKAFNRFAVRLLDAAGLPLKSDGLADDNVRHAVVEVRKKVPVLIIDGNPEGRSGPVKDKKGGDSYYIAAALHSVTDSKYEVEYGDRLAAGDARDALMLPELSNFTSILLLNVPDLTDDQLARLEQFVKDGGGVAFFMGPRVKASFYNDQLYKKGHGLFPVPIEDNYRPLDLKLKEPEYTGRYQILLRDDQFPKSEKLPIFGPVFKQKNSRNFLKHLYVERHWPALPMSKWEGDPGKVRQVANLPNESAASAYAVRVRELAKRLPFDQREYKDYRAGLEKHFQILNKAASEKATYPAYLLADLLKDMLTDPGKGKKDDPGYEPNLVEFWDLRDSQVQDLYQDVVNLRQELLYSSPIVLLKDYGLGRVVAWMTTAGTEWNPWPSGSPGSPAYAPLMYELQNYLTSSSGDSGSLVGSIMKLTADGKRFDQNKELKIVRRFYKPNNDKPEDKPVRVDFSGTRDARLFWTFTMDGALEPGFYQSDLHYGDAVEGTPPLMSWGHVFNVDTAHEGNLARVSQEELDSGFMRQVSEKMAWRRTDDVPVVINKAWELSEWPFFFLIFIGILVCEQALAVHLSHHLRTDEAELPTQVVRPQARAA